MWEYEPGEEPISMRLTAIEAGVSFVDEMRGDGLVVITEHRVEAGRVVYRTSVSGPGEAEIGPSITADFPDVLGKLVALAAR